MTTVTTNYIRNAQRHASFPSIAAATAIYDTQRLVRLNPDIWRGYHPENFGTFWDPETLPLESNTGAWSIGPGVVGGTSTQDSNRVAQSFMVSSGALIDHVVIDSRIEGAPTDGLVLDIVEDLDGPALATSTIADASSQLSTATTPQWLSFYLATPVHLKGLRTYYLRLSRTGARDGVNRCDWPATNSAYANGNLFTVPSTTWQEDGGHDAKFKIYGIPIDYAIPPPMPQRRNSLLRR